MPRLDGTVVRLVRDKKFGFIKLTDGREGFFHMRDCLSDAPFDELEEGARVTCEYDPHAPKGPRASQVSLS